MVLIPSPLEDTGLVRFILINGKEVENVKKKKI